MAASSAVKEALWLKQLMLDLGVNLTTMTVRCDNQGTIKLACNPQVSNRSKHIDVAHHFIRERIAMGHVDLVYLATSMMPADMLTKAVPRDKFEFYCGILGLH